MRFRFIASGRPYEDLGIVAIPGEVYELDKDPGDGNWEAVDPPKKTAAKTAAPAADAAKE